ncbi:MAG TPA: ABC transporter ATP-binding protein [Acholeplasmataceae bacterium]|jgi:ATP-binding cassette subfamily B protein|nr:ABC transporter ATP-binding protein [Acholeplasmataceae bacterium]
MKKTLKNIKLLFQMSPLYVITYIIRGIVASVTPFVNIIFSYLILDGLILGQTKEEVFNTVLLMISINLGLAIIQHITTYIIEKRGVVIEFKLAEAISLKAIDLDYELQEDQKVMELITMAQEGSNSNGGLLAFADLVFQGILKYTLQIIYSIVLLIGVVVIKNNPHDSTLSKVLNHPLSGLSILIFLLAAVIASALLNAKLQGIMYNVTMRNIDANRRFGYLFRVNMDYQLGKDVRLYHMQDMILSIMKDKRTSSEEAWWDFVKFQNRFERISLLMSHLLLFTSYAYVGLKALYGFISVGEVLRYVGAITTLSASITQILVAFSTLKLMNTYLSHYDTFLNLESKMKYGSEVLDTNELSIEFKNVSFKYPNTENYILKDINLTINPYDKIAIVGENGAGKTTFIKLLARLYDPTEGEILVNGKNISKYSEESVRDMFSIVFQDFKLFSYSIKDNITIGEEDRGVEKVLIEAGFGERLKKIPEGVNATMYNRFSQDDGEEFSGGEEQKIAIARALYKNSPFVILDEPTSALDPLAEEEIYLKFNDLTKNKTSIFISHRMSSCKFCQKIIVLDHEEILESGTHYELMQNKNKYYELFSAQAKYYN